MHMYAFMISIWMVWTRLWAEKMGEDGKLWHLVPAPRDVSEYAVGTCTCQSTCTSAVQQRICPRVEAFWTRAVTPCYG